MATGQDNQERGVLNFPFLGMVVSDKAEHSWDIEVYPMEIMPTYSGDLTANPQNNVQQTNVFGENKNVTVSKDRRIRCRWLPLFDTSNRVSPPSVRKGETVIVINFAGLDKYFWVNGMYADYDLRKLENMTQFLSNKQSVGDNDLTKGYYRQIDTYNKFIAWHTSDNDKEHCTYDYLLNTKEGNFKLWDGKDNYLKWDTQYMQYQFHTDTVNGEYCTYDWILNSKEGYKQFIDGYNNYFKWDTKNKKYHLHTDTKNSEPTSYDIILDSGGGTLTVKDGKGNQIKLDSNSNSLEINTNNQMVINTTNSVTVNTNTATINAKASATIKTAYCKIDSKNCQIN